MGAGSKLKAARGGGAGRWAGYIIFGAWADVGGGASSLRRRRD